MRTGIVLLSVLCAAGLQGLAQDSPLVFGSDRVQGPANLYQIDLEDQTSTVLGTFGEEYCVGLEIHNGGLYSLCLSDEEFFLLRLDEDEPPLPVLPATEEVGEFRDFNSPRDFILTDDLIVVVNFVIPDVPILPPVFSELRTFERTTGQPLQRIGPTQILNLSTDPAAPARPFALMFAEARYALGRLELDDLSEEAQVTLPAGFAYYDFAFNSSSGDFLAAVEGLPGGSTVQMARINPQQGTLQPLFETSSRLRYLEVNNPISDTQESQRIAPIFIGRPLDPNFSVVSTLTLFNGSATTQGSASVMFFNDQGQEVGDRFCSPELGVPDGFAVQPGHLLSDPLDARQSFDGWGLVRTQGPVEVVSEVAFVQQEAASLCDSGLDAIPSTRIQTAVQIPLVVPGRSFTAPVTIAAQRESAFAIVNPDPLAEATVEFEAVREDGTVLDANQVVIAPRNRRALLLFEWLIEGKAFPLPPQRPDDYRGFVRIRSDRPVAIAGLTVLLPEGKWSNLPVLSSEEP